MLRRLLRPLLLRRPHDLPHRFLVNAYATATACLGEEKRPLRYAAISAEMFFRNSFLHRDERLRRRLGDLRDGMFVFTPAFFCALSAPIKKGNSNVYGTHEHTCRHVRCHNPRVLWLQQQLKCRATKQVVHVCLSKHAVLLCLHAANGREVVGLP